MAIDLAPSCPQTGAGQAAALSSGPHEQARPRLRMTGDAPGQPVPNREHVIRGRTYPTGAGH